jgi:release factor glutamine methyltransferase
VRDYEPRVALDGGADGLDPSRAIAEQAQCIMAAGGHLVIEIGAGQDTAVAAILGGRGLAVAAGTRDISGILRALTAVGACQPGISGR